MLTLTAQKIKQFINWLNKPRYAEISINYPHVLDINTKAKLINFAMSAESEHYSCYVLRGILIELEEMEKQYNSEMILEFLRETSMCTRRLYLELIALSPKPVIRNAISYKL